MPHCILEYSSNIVDSPDIRDLLKKLHETLAATGEFHLNDIKSRAIRHDDYVVGDGDPKRAFVALNVCVLDGREDDARNEISQQAMGLLRDAFPETVKQRKCSITVRVTELDRASYQRLVSY